MKFSQVANALPSRNRMALPDKENDKAYSTCEPCTRLLSLSTTRGKQNTIYSAL